MLDLMCSHTNARIDSLRVARCYLLRTLQPATYRSPALCVVQSPTMPRFHRASLMIALALLAIEVLIALFVHDRFNRPYVGDVLVVPLIHFAVRSVFRVDPAHLIVGVLLFAAGIECTQYLGMINAMGLSRNSFARVVLGNTFQWADLAAYAIGAWFAYQVDRHNIQEEPSPMKG